MAELHHRTLDTRGQGELEPQIGHSILQYKGSRVGREALQALVRARPSRSLGRTVIGVLTLVARPWVAEHAHRLLRELEAADRAIDSARSGRTGLFRITADPMWSAAVLADAVGRFQQGYPAIEPRVETATRAEGLRRLADGENVSIAAASTAQNACPSSCATSRPST